MNVIAHAKNKGFAEAFLLPVTPYPDWTRRRQDGVFHHNADALTEDPTTAYPWANALLICVWAYAPYDDDSVVAAYYPASNQAYHAMQALLQDFSAAGIQACRSETPLRTQLLAHGLGSRMDNQLWYLAPYGTYVALQGAMLKLDAPVPYTPRKEEATVCDHCGACDRACPALQQGAFDPTKCLRAYLEGAPIPSEQLPNLKCLLGCQRCQDVCPKNAVPRVPVPQSVRDALDPITLIRGDSKAAGEIVGKNLRKRLLQQAIVLAANQDRTDALPLLLALQQSNCEQLHTALSYAIKRLQK